MRYAGYQIQEFICGGCSHKDKDVYEDLKCLYCNMHVHLNCCRHMDPQDIAVARWSIGFQGQYYDSHPYIAVCKQCDHKATNLKSLREHTASQHEGVRYACDQCDTVATTPGHLNRHKASKHQGIKYPCDQCEFAATDKSNLVKHKASKHEGVRYPCDQCDYKATEKSSLKRHQRLKHFRDRN